jgi:hypothetical protein
MRLALIDRAEAARGAFGQNRFSGLAALLESRGHEVLVRDNAQAIQPGAPPILTGLNRAVAAGPMIDAHRLTVELADFRPDLVIGPLRGGLTQGVLMTRACGEAFPSTRVAIWCDTPSRNRFLHSDELSQGLRPLIAEALERQTMALADAFIAPHDKQENPPDWLVRIEPKFWATLPPALGDTVTLGPKTAKISEIVFVGPVCRRSGIVEFIEAMQRLSRDGLLAHRTVVFLGHVPSESHGMGKEWLGLRAGTWPFLFKVVDDPSTSVVERYLSEPGRLAVAIGDDVEEFGHILRCGPHHVTLLRRARPPHLLIDVLEAKLREALNAGFTPIRSSAPPTDWDRLIRKLGRLAIRMPGKRLHPVAIHRDKNSRAPQATASWRIAMRRFGTLIYDLCTWRSPGVSVCVLHRNRLEELGSALRSIPDNIGRMPIELIVLDNCSEMPNVADEIRWRAGRRRYLRVIRFALPVSQPFALNRGLAESRYARVLFLDDDNTYVPGGLARLARAVEPGRFDIAVTPLDIFDGPRPEEAHTTGRLIFLGDAHSVGLFFNAFGDTSMAVDREAFLRTGGFFDPGYEYPALDWVTLAKSRAAGLRIGALQWPAVRYRRDIRRAELSANKIDQKGAREFVFEAYGGKYDAEVIGRYAQMLQLEEL